jgi:L-asparaginase II
MTPLQPAQFDGAALVEVLRGGHVESVHSGHVAVCDASGGLRLSLGDPEAVIFPRSSCKMIQALPLVESGAADAFGPRQLALACASHQGAPLHVAEVSQWLADLGLGDSDLRCGPEPSRDRDLRNAMIRAGEAPCQIHNNCSGKHTGFLTLARHLGAGPEYVDLDHPVQRAVHAAFVDVTGEASPGYGIDGCSAPNFLTTVAGLARAMAAFATAGDGDARGRAMLRLRQAMVAHPDLVAGEGRACTDLMRAMDGVAVKTGAEGVFVAMLPAQGLGIALKVADGATRAAEATIAALLVHLGALDPAHPAARALLHQTLRNRRGLAVGEVRPVANLADRR